MKNTLLVTAIFLFASHTFAQVPEPEFKYQPMLLSDGHLLPLEKQGAEVKHSGYGGGSGGLGYAPLNPPKDVIFLEGLNSDVRTSTQPIFIMKIDPDIDPETIFYLTLTTQKKKRREVELSKQGFFGGPGKSNKRFHIKLRFEKVSPGIYKIIPTEVLEDGEEYTFVRISQNANSANSTLFAFGVGKAK